MSLFQFTNKSVKCLNNQVPYVLSNVAKHSSLVPISFLQTLLSVWGSIYESLDKTKWKWRPGWFPTASEGGISCVLSQIIQYAAVFSAHPDTINDQFQSPLSQTMAGGVHVSFFPGNVPSNYGFPVVHRHQVKVAAIHWSDQALCFMCLSQHQPICGVIEMEHAHSSG